MKRIQHIRIYILLGCIPFVACHKYLSEKSSSLLVVPDSLGDLQALLDRTVTTNSSDPSALAISSNEYYLSDNDFTALTSDYDKRKYQWDSAGLFQPGAGNDWYNLYQLVYVANTVISDMGNIPQDPSSVSDRQDVEGQAYFYRGKTFYNIASIWCKTFDSTTANADPGIPLRLNPDFNVPSTRSTLMATYKQLLSDLKQSAALLPVTPIHAMRPSKGAAYGMLARICLFMGDYQDAYQYADSALSINSTLIDFNTLNSAKTYPIAQFNPETIYYSSISIPAILNISRAKIDSSIYRLYDQHDLRKVIFFRKNADGSFGFRGNYTSGLALFGGVSVNELLLIHSEAAVRSGNVSTALSDLNRLRQARWDNHYSYVPFSSGDIKTVLDSILLERRKELPMRGLWWQDVKRLNREGVGISLQRTVLGQPLVLAPGSKRFVLPIPEDIIRLTGIQQN